ncbi:vWA domain-containing protein [Spiribacter halobius]|nr:vWA domain-containing protein [Spiribacter halobius]UEX76362.1 VWA domain-containing protein [Spiribacter halobius]
MRRLPHLLAGLLFIACAAAPAGADDAVRLLVDVSGSMREHDPRALRAPALELAVDLLPQGTEAGIWHFADRPEAMTAPAAVDDGWRKAARGAVTSVDSRGQYTDLTAAIDAATRGWDEPASTGRRSLILLTDGVIDVPDNADGTSRRRLIEEIVPRLQAADVTLYPVSLSTESGLDEALLTQLAAATGGEVIVTPDAETLERRMIGLMDRVAAGDALPLRGNRFQVDQSVRELTLVAFRPEGAKVALQPPAGRPFAAADAPDNVRWRREGSHEIVTIARPTPGEWTLQAPADPANRVRVVTDLRLRAEPLPQRLLPGESARLTAWLADGQRRIDEPRFLELIRLEVDGPGVSAPLVLEPDSEGRFATDVQPLLAGAGAQEVVIRADGGTFQREWRQRLEVMASPVALGAAEAAEAGTLAVDARLVSDWLAPESLQLTAAFAAPGLQGERLSGSETQPGRWRLESAGLAPGTAVLVSVRLEGLTLSGRPVSTLLPPEVIAVAAPAAAAEPSGDPAAAAAGTTAATATAAAGAASSSEAEPSAPADEGRGVNWWLVGAVLILANLLVLLAGLTVWLVLRRRAAAGDDGDGAERTGPDADAAAEEDAPQEEEAPREAATG